MLEQLDKDMIAAMKNKEKERLIVIREVKAALKQANIDFKKEINEELLIEVVSRGIKTRKESIKEFEKGNRQDLIDKTNFEIEVLSKYLPEQLTEEEILELIKQVIEEVKPESPKDMGKVMGKITPLVKGKADMAFVSSKIKENLTF
ncbi:MAG: GatB/YqeY domain-containing protein [Firmicutes bacterium]|nr:GatB/YqeY domain-containing protein [Bacillota bacterium]